MNLVVNRKKDYVLLPVHNLRGVTEFFIARLGLKLIKRDFKHAGYSGALFLNEIGGNYFVFECAGNIEMDVPIIETPDCIKMCYYLGAFGCEISCPPFYTNEGVLAEFRDYYGNKFLLRERRDLVET
jgi:hypothetical protein